MLLRNLVIAGGLLASLAAAPSAVAAPSGTYLYDVTVRAEMKDQWSFRQEGDIGTPWDPCHVAHVGDGSALWQLHSRRPTRVMVMKGSGGRPPALNVGTGEGVPLTGSYKRTGSDVETHSGGKCAAANPPHAQDTSGCGTKSAGFAFNLAWVDNKPGRVYPSAVPSEPTENCPSGPPWALDWDNDDEGPSIMEASTAVAGSKFLGTKQFTLRGTKTFTGTLTSGNRSANQTITWSWEATYRKVGAKKKTRRGA